MAVTPDVSIRIGAELKEFRAALNQVKADMAQLAQQGRRTSDAMGGANTGIGQIAGTVRAASSAVKQLIGGLIALQGVRMFFGLVQQGVEFNKTLETAELGIASLIAAQSELVDAQGKAVEGQDALTVAIGLSKQQMRELRIAGLQTAATTTQLVEAFQQAVGPGLTAGLNLDEVRQVTVQIVQAAGALGVPMNQIAQEVRAILDGTIDINARVAKSLGITNEQVNTWKQQGTLVAELNKRMSAFADAGARAADTFEVIKSNTQEAFESVAGELTTGYFDKIKAALKDATSGIFDTKTLGISEAFRDLASLTKEIIDLVGDGLAGAIRGVVDLAERFSAYIRANREDLSELVQSAGMLLDQFSQLVGVVLEIVVGIGDAGVKTSIFAKIIQIIAVLIAGVRDGFRFIGSVITWLGSLIIKVVLAPLETLTAILAEIVGLANKEAGAQLRNLSKQIDGISKRGFEAASDLMAPIADGTGAVATAIKQIDELQKKAKTAGQAQQSAAGGATGGVTGSKGGKGGDKGAAEVKERLRRISDAEFIVAKAQLDAERRLVEESFKAKRISAEDYYSQINALRQRESDLEVAKMLKEQQALAEHLARIREMRANTPQQKADKNSEIANVQIQIDELNAKIEAAKIRVASELATAQSEMTRGIFENLERRFSESMSRMAAIEQSYRNQREAGLLSESQMRQKIIDLHHQTAEEVEKVVIEMEKIAGGLGDEYVTKAMQARNTFNEVASSQGEINAAIKEQIEMLKAIAAINQATADARKQAGISTDMENLREQEAVNRRQIELLREEQSLLRAIGEEGQALQIEAQIIRLGAQLDLVADKFREVFETHIEGFFNAVIDGTKSFGDALKDMVSNIFKDISKMIAKDWAQQIIKVLSGKSGDNPSLGGRGFFSFLADLIFPSTGSGFKLFHDGGIVGAGGTMRYGVNPLVFAGAPRYHDGGMVGLKPNEVPAILEKGETVRTAEQESALQRGGGYRIVNVIDPSMVADYMTSAAGEQVVLNTIGRNPGYVKQLLGA